MRITLSVFSILAVLGAATTSALAQKSAPTEGAYSYHEMRTLSGLGGGSYGTDAEGYVSLSGPIAFSTPVANTLGHNRFWLGGSQYSYKSYPVANTRDSNSGYTATYGATIGRRVNLAASANFVDTHFTTLFDLQAQWIPATKDKFTYAIGVADLLDHTKSYNNAGQRVSSLSTFAVTTYRTHLGRYATSLTAGTGSRRFGPFFGSATVQLARPLRLWSEEDRYGNVFGLTFASQLGHSHHAAPVTLSLGMAQTRYAVAQAGIGF